jgi:PIN domain nuclease of toxin-antitoxin system
MASPPRFPASRAVSDVKRCAFFSCWEIKVQLKHDKLPIRMQFNSVDEAKEFADNYKPVVIHKPA